MTTRNGWHALPPHPDAGPVRWVVNDGLYVDGRCVAVVEAFHDDGPFYANAITTDGEHVRAGAVDTQANAMDWCERMTSYRPLAIHAQDPRP